MSDRFYPGDKFGWRLAMCAANHDARRTGRRQRIHHVGSDDHRYWVVSEVVL